MQTLDPALQAALAAHGVGRSTAALQRFAARTRGRIHTGGEPGDVIRMSRGREYVVAKDGAFLRLGKRKK